MKISNAMAELLLLLCPNFNAFSTFRPELLFYGQICVANFWTPTLFTLGLQKYKPS